MAAFTLVYLEKFFRKITPAVISMVVVPFCSLLLSVIAAHFVLGPIGWKIGSAVSSVVYAGITGSLKTVFAAIFGFVYAPLVITGLHHMSNAIDMQLIADYGGTMLWPMIALSNIAQGSAVVGMMYLQKKNAEAQEVNIPAAISCYLGVTEPAIFGVNLKHTFPFVCAMIGSACAAILCVGTSTTANAIGVGKELSMVFSFHHLKTDFAGNEKWVLVPNDFMKLKKILFGWQRGMAEHDAWNALFWCNHDQPRIVSRFGDDGQYWKESAKMLATMIHLMRGTPYIYQGEEIGMTNHGFTRIEQYRDVESLNHFEILQKKGMTEADAYRILQLHSRDNGRTPMLWNGKEHGGFTTGTPWIEANKNYRQINAESQVGDPDSIFSYYKNLVQLRKNLDIIAYGDIQPLDENHTSVFAYERTYGDEKLVVVCNFYKEEVDWKTGMDLSGFEKLTGNYADVMMNGENVHLRPYEAVVFYKK